MALRAAPVIPGLTEPFQGLKGHHWQQALAKLRRIKLLGAASVNDPNTLDAHPLVREHFKQQLKRERPEAWREANNRLYEHLTRTAKELPDTVEEMSPLYAAISHGCAAGRHQEALLDVYYQRIHRKDMSFNWQVLGAFGADLVAVSNFFEVPWEQPVANLTDDFRAFLLSQTGSDLRALGRLQEAAQPLQAALEMWVAIKNWRNATLNATHISELYLAMGDLPHAIKLAHESVELGERSDYKFDRVVSQTTLANAFHQAGYSAEAAAKFCEAEALQQEWRPTVPFLYSGRGFHYCDLLIDQGQAQKVKARATLTLQIAKYNNWLLHSALDNLSLGRAWLLEVQQAGTSNTTKAAEFLQRAIDGLRQAGEMRHLPRGLLVRAELHRFNGDYGRAERDLAEALRIATRGGMGLYLADYHLESARLHLAQGNPDKAREHLATAREMIEHMGYHRRDNEVSELAEQLG
jgi:tetratricopeptide (TPR) repeat protein